MKPQGHPSHLSTVKGIVRAPPSEREDKPRALWPPKVRTKTPTKKAPRIGAHRLVCLDPWLGGRRRTQTRFWPFLREREPARTKKHEVSGQSRSIGVPSARCTSQAGPAPAVEGGTEASRGEKRSVRARRVLL